MTKKMYTSEEINELKNWFESHKEQWPKAMQIDKSTYTPDLAKTIDTLFAQAYICHGNPKMQGCILILEKIKENLEQ